MKIVADENIPYVKDAFGTLGEVRLLPGRKMDAAAVREADLLLVRSVTKVNAALLEGSRVRFVGTATIGTDHVDLPWLQRAGIAFSAAPGSNANSVGEYIVAALLTLSARHGWTLAGRSVGVVGVGNVGSRVAAKAAALGMRVLLNDPPLQRATQDAKYRPLEELFACDFITLHVPLEKNGTDPTWHLADAAFLGRMKRDAVLLNSSRGPVADNAALLRALEEGRLADAVLDVWEGEPGLNAALLRRAALGTPHIAGYSFDGKVNGTRMLYEAACKLLGVKPTWDAATAMPPPETPQMALQAAGRNEEEVLHEAVRRIYSIEHDDAALRRLLDMPEPERAPWFDRLRKEYPVRREFQNTRVTLAGATPSLAKKFAGIGFRLSIINHQ